MSLITATNLGQFVIISVIRPLSNIFVRMGSTIPET